MSSPHLIVTGEQYSELIYAASHHPKPYMRERCAALRKLAEGWLIGDVARHGLLNVHSPDTVHDWLEQYRANGIAGLLIAKGRGRKPSFSPCASNGRTGQRTVDRVSASGPTTA